MRTVGYPLTTGPVQGNCGSFALRAVQGEVVHFVMLTFLGNPGKAIAKVCRQRILRSRSTYEIRTVTSYLNWSLT